MAGITLIPQKTLLVQYIMYLYILQVVSSSCIVEGCAKAWINTVHVQRRGSVGDEEGEGEGGGGNAGCMQRQAAIGVCLSQQIWAAINEDLQRNQEREGERR